MWRFFLRQGHCHQPSSWAQGWGPGRSVKKEELCQESVELVKIEPRVVSLRVTLDSLLHRNAIAGWVRMGVVNSLDTKMTADGVKGLFMFLKV